MSTIRTTPPLLAALLAALAGCSSSGSATAPDPGIPTWHNSQVNAVSTAETGAGVAATTSLRPDGTLETVALDLSDGHRLWASPATMVGRLPGMGVQPPAVVPGDAAKGGGGGKGATGTVAAIEPQTGGAGASPGATASGQASASPAASGAATPGTTAQGTTTPGSAARGAAGAGGAPAALVARDARTGHRRWSRPIRSSFGPQRCGGYLCVSEDTALSTARLVVLDPATGRQLWRLPGIAEVEWYGKGKVVLLRLAGHPVLEQHDLRTGRTLWRQPVERALGADVDLSAGWAFGATSTDLIGYVAPYSDPKKGITSAFGMFSVRLKDGAVNWMRPSVVRVYPSGSPGVAPVVRPVDKDGRFGGFAVLDAASGRVTGQITSDQVPGSGWWLAFPSRFTSLGFLRRDGGGSVFDLATGREAQVKGRQGWSFCVTDPKPLRLRHITPAGFYPVAALCEFDLATGERVTGAGAPPAWFTGSQDGWRLWRDDRGGLHAVKDGTATFPSMYGT